MNNIYLLLKELNSTVDVELFIQNLPFLEKSINGLLLEIKNANNLEQANVYFRLLEQIQTTLAKFLFQKHVNLKATLKKFVRDFDRIDDPEMRQYFFTTIKAGIYAATIE